MLVDCPAWNRETQAFLEGQGGVRWLFLTHRGAMAQVREIQQALGCDVVVQEQEAYLLPQVRVTAFEQAFALTPNVRALWTAGHSPGSACLYAKHFGGVLFSGRHLLPNPTGELVPLKLSKTFHWQRQIQSLQGLLDQFSPETLQWICPGANLGFLRGKYAIANAYQQLERAMAVVTLPPSQPISQ